MQNPQSSCPPRYSPNLPPSRFQSKLQSRPLNRLRALPIFCRSSSAATHTSPRPAPRQLEGTVVSLSADQVFLDIGYKTEGVLPRSAFENNAEGVKPGDTFPVSVTGRNEEGYYELSRFKVAQPRDWSALEAAFAQKLAVVGTVTAVVKGGLTVDIGVRAFMPASRSGTRDAAELEKLVGTEITCRITKLDVTDEDVVVDRRVVLEEQARALQADRHAAMQPGDTLTGTVRTLMPYGAFVDLGGVDGLLHISDISWSRVNKPEDVLTVGQELQVRILKIDPETKKISLGLKQLQPEPWETAPDKYSGRPAHHRHRHAPHGLRRICRDRTRRRRPHPYLRDVLGQESPPSQRRAQAGRHASMPSFSAIKPEERRISLGLKQTLADPWSDVSTQIPRRLADSRARSPSS